MAAMDDRMTQEMLLAKLNAPVEPPLAATRRFLQSYCDDAGSIDEIRKTLRRNIAYTPRPAIAALVGMEALLGMTDLPPGTLATLVAQDANWVLDNPLDDGARVWLADMARLLRQQPRSSSQDGTSKVKPGWPTNP